MKSAGNDDDPDRQQRANPKRDGDFANGRDPAIKQHDGENTDADLNQVGLERRHFRPEIANMLGKTDISGGDFQRGAKQELPDEQKNHEPPKTSGTESVPKIGIAAARSRH